ncbi:uncharacterized protein EDB91DRAFT_1086850 [Suillus paluster]|uniref:uncharacterized protein n=1 Tax=Suillus paluster TaxID=48578 RepID=UPI001B86B0A4|nr:uncharacterized protein EDB91DRAFT_1086850 [Suillus paluster]KAG1726171.1 hypothetical protein EDB91DRAFT_1086850 [Suillus paluster]
MTDNLSSNRAYGTNHSPHQIIPDYNDRYQNTSRSTIRWDPNQVSQAPTHPQNTHRPTYVDSVPHGNLNDQYANQRHDTDPQGTSHPQSTYVSTYDDSMPQKPQDQYINQLLCTDPRFNVLNSQDQYADQPPYVDPGTPHLQSMHDLVYVDSGGHMNPHDQYTDQLYDIVPQGPPHPQNMHHSTYIGSVPHTDPGNQYANQRHDADPQGILHPQSTHVSTYNDSRPHTNPHDQSANHSNFSDNHPGPGQLISLSQTTHYPPAHGLDYYHRVGSPYYHAPHPEMSYERPDPLAQSSDWMHSVFDVHNASNRVEEGPSVDLEPARHQHDFNRLRYHRTSNWHTPYTVSKIRNNHLIPRNVGHGEGPSHSAAQSVLPLVLDTQPVTMPPPTPTTLSPAISIIFGLADLPSCTIFANSFFLDTATVGTMANECMDAVVLHDDDLIAWSKTLGGKSEVSKLSKAFGMIKKNIQFLSCSAVLWGYGLHSLLMEKPKKEVKEFIQGTKVEVTFGNITICNFVRQLLFHDRKYVDYIGQDRNIQHLLNFVGVAFNWVLDELSTGVFKIQDLKMNEKTLNYSEELEKLFNTMPIEHRNALGSQGQELRTKGPIGPFHSHWPCSIMLRIMRAMELAAMAQRAIDACPHLSERDKELNHISSWLELAHIAEEEAGLLSNNLVAHRKIYLEQQDWLRNHTDSLLPRKLKYMVDNVICRKFWQTQSKKKCPTSSKPVPPTITIPATAQIPNSSLAPASPMPLSTGSQPQCHIISSIEPQTSITVMITQEPSAIEYLCKEGGCEETIRGEEKQKELLEEGFLMMEARTPPPSYPSPPTHVHASTQTEPEDTRSESPQCAMPINWADKVDSTLFT